MGDFSMSVAWISSESRTRRRCVIARQRLTKDEDAGEDSLWYDQCDGGVLVVGMKAEYRPKDEPDVITAKAPALSRNFAAVGRF